MISLYWDEILLRRPTLKLDLMERLDSSGLLVQLNLCLNRDGGCLVGIHIDGMRAATDAV